MSFHVGILAKIGITIIGETLDFLSVSCLFLMRISVVWQTFKKGYHFLEVHFLEVVNQKSAFISKSELKAEEVL